MCSAEVLISPSDLEGATGVGPPERFGEDGVEVVNEGQHALPQIVGGGKTGPLEKTAGQDRESEFDLVEPGAVPRRVDNEDPGRLRIGVEGPVDVGDEVKLRADRPD